MLIFFFHLKNCTGTWGDWSDGECTAECGGIGELSRTRSCVKDDCQGNSVSIISCTKSGCAGNNMQQNLFSLFVNFQNQLFYLNNASYCFDVCTSMD